MDTTNSVGSAHATSADHHLAAASVLKRVSWGAIAAGAVFALVLQLLLSMLGAGIGLSTVDPLRGDTPSAESFGMGAVIWWVVAGLISAYLGGWLAGKLSGFLHAGDRSWHGLLAWAVSTLVTAYVLGSAAGSLTGGVASTLGGAASTATSAAADAASDNPDRAGQAAQSAQSAAQAAREKMASPEAQQEARRLADETAKNTSRAMLWSFLALVLGALLATFGARAARPH
jgi:hypothetical protein